MISISHSPKFVCSCIPTTHKNYHYSCTFSAFSSVIYFKSFCYLMSLMGVYGGYLNQFTNF